MEALGWNESEKWAGSLPRLKLREMGGGLARRRGGEIETMAEGGGL